MPRRRRSAAGPIPERRRISAEPYTPAQRITWPALILVRRPSIMAITAAARPAAWPGPAGPAGELDPVDERVRAYRQAGMVADGVEIGEGTVPANAARRVDRADRNARSAAGIQEIVPVRQPGRHRSVQERPLERLQVAHAGLLNPQALHGVGTVPVKLGAGPSRVRGSPGIPVAAPADRLRTAVVAAAAADHPGPGKRQHPAVGGRAAVAPVVRGAHGIRVDQVGRPGWRLPRPWIWPGLEHGNRRPGPGRIRGQHRARRSGADDDNVGRRGRAYARIPATASSSTRPAARSRGVEARVVDGHVHPGDQASLHERPGQGHHLSHAQPSVDSPVHRGHQRIVEAVGVKVQPDAVHARRSEERGRMAGRLLDPGGPQLTQVADQHRLGVNVAAAVRSCCARSRWP